MLRNINKMYSLKELMIIVNNCNDKNQLTKVCEIVNEYKYDYPLDTLEPFQLYVNGF